MGNSYDELWQDCMDYYVTETYSDCTPCYVPQTPLFRRIAAAIWHQFVRFAEWMKP